MKVQCSLCEFEVGGFCVKKKRRGKPIKIKTNKKRICDKYTEDGMRVFGQYRKKEAHKAGVHRQLLRRAQLAHAVEQAKQAGISAFIDEAKEDDNGNA